MLDTPLFNSKRVWHRNDFRVCPSHNPENKWCRPRKMAWFFDLFFFFFKLNFFQASKPEAVVCPVGCVGFNLQTSVEKATSDFKKKKKKHKPQAAACERLLKPTRFTILHSVQMTSPNSSKTVQKHQWFRKNIRLASTVEKQRLVPSRRQDVARKEWRIGEVARNCWASEGFAR